MATNYPASFYANAFAKHCKELGSPVPLSRDINFYRAMQVWLLTHGCEYFPGDEQRFKWDDEGEQLAFVLRWA